MSANSDAIDLMPSNEKARAQLRKVRALMGDTYQQADEYFRQERPDAVVLIDYPGFNWWIARQAKKHGIPVIYYGAPQMWAWGAWRIRKMRRLVDHVLCTLPFEADWYRERGCAAVYMGHPYFDHLTKQVVDLVHSLHTAH